jgi:hypothetical protein
MTRRVCLFFALSLSLIGCGALAVKPATAARPMTAGSMDRAMKAAMNAASATNWVPKTISAETGYILAERETTVVGGGNRTNTYKLEVTVPSGGS